MVSVMAVNDLAYLIREDTPVFFTILNINSSFLNATVKEWHKNKSFIAAKNVISNLCIV